MQLKFDSLDPLVATCLEIQQCKGDLAALLGNHNEALEIWKPLIERCPGSRSVHKRVIKLGVTCRDSRAVVRATRLALNRFGEDPDFLSSLTAIKLHQRQPGLGQRSSLLGMVWHSLGLADVDIANQFSCYEMNGYVDWLEYVLPSAIESPIDQQTTNSNLTMQLASISSPKYESHLKAYVSGLQSSQQNALYKNSSKLKQVSLPGSRLEIAWVIGDLPASRKSLYAYQFFAGSLNHEFRHDHILVNTFNHGKESCESWFENLSNLSVVDVSSHKAEKRVSNSLFRCRCRA